MAEFTSHTPGSFSWIELATPDLDGAKNIYGSLFGWETKDLFDAHGNSTYAMSRLNGKSVAGMGLLPTDGEVSLAWTEVSSAGTEVSSAGTEVSSAWTEVSSAWSSYISVLDVDATAEAVVAAGGTVLLAPMDVSKSERMATFADPTGAAFSAWKAGAHMGVGLANVANTYSWNELLTRDVPTAQAFYSEVFGWRYDTEQTSTGEYLIINDGAGGRIAGMLEMPTNAPGERVNHWNVYFTVDDLDAVVEKAQQMGGQVVAPESILLQTRRVITLADSWGATFTLLEPLAQ